MNQAPTQHPSPEQLQAFGQGRLSPAEQTAIERHVAACDHCCQLLREVPDDTLLDRLRTTNTPRERSLQDAGDTQPTYIGPGASALPQELIDHPRYRIVKQLGAGGMGVVYLAEHRLMERTVALKVISRQLTGDSLAVDRFRQEVKAAARMSHPNIVAAYDAEQAGDLHFLVMEYVEGVSLAKYVDKKGPLPVVHACNFIKQAAQGLQQAAAQGMVHRDLKPQNLMLTRKGQVKILDFGLARLGRDQGPVYVADASRPGLTAVGTVLGTPDYMAPEQAHDSRKVDVRSDIYSLGCTLYFLLTGRPPFVGGSALDKLLAHVSDPIKPVTQFRQDVPPELVQVLERMMAKDPAQRFPTPAELTQALTPFCQRPQPVGVAVPEAASPLAFFDDETQPRPMPAARRRPPAARPWLAPTAVLALLSLAVAGSWLAHLALKPGTPAEASSRVVAAGPTPPRATPPGPNLVVVSAQNRPRVLFVLAQNGFFWSDFGPVRDDLEKGGIDVDVASSARTDAQPAPNSNSAPVTPKLLLSEAKVKDYDAVIFGGIGIFTPGAVNEFEAEGKQAVVARKFCEDMLKADKYVTALCGGVCVLADAGVLKDREFTGPEFHPSLTAKLMKAQDEGAKPLLKESVIVSGRVITGRDFNFAREFAEVLLEKLKANRPANPE